MPASPRSGTSIARIDPQCLEMSDAATPWAESVLLQAFDNFFISKSTTSLDSDSLLLCRHSKGKFFGEAISTAMRSYRSVNNLRSGDVVPREGRCRTGSRGS